MYSRSARQIEEYAMRTRLVLLLVFVTIFAVALAGCAELGLTDPTPTPPAVEPGVTPEETPDEPAVVPDDTPDVDEDVRVIEIDAEDLEFSPDEIDVDLGETVRFVLNSIDETHTFTVKRNIGDAEPLFTVEIPAGSTQEVTWTFDENGEYYFYCEYHEAEGMWGTITVND
jgi:plastocyanin